MEMKKNIDIEIEGDVWDTYAILNKSYRFGALMKKKKAKFVINMKPCGDFLKVSVDEDVYEESIEALENDSIKFKKG